VGTIRRRVVSTASTLAISLSLSVWTRAEAATESPVRLLLHVYDYAGVAPGIRAAALQVTRDIYAAIAVEIIWVDHCPLSCHLAFSLEPDPDITGGDLLVTVLPDAMTSREFPIKVMGYAPENGSIAYAFFGRIRAFAFERDVLLATLLGHVIAHEVGHILLREGHAPKGLMRARWLDEELLRARTGRLGFTATQGRVIRSRLTRSSSR